jgi:hypothetical protein
MKGSLGNAPGAATMRRGDARSVPIAPPRKVLLCGWFGCWPVAAARILVLRSITVISLCCRNFPFAAARFAKLCQASAHKLLSNHTSVYSEQGVKPYAPAGIRLNRLIAKDSPRDFSEPE